MHFSNNPPQRSPLPVYKEKDIVLVLGGGGGAKGLAHVGVLQELIKNNIYPDLIIGCSAGAIVGALYADSLDVRKVKAILLKSSSKEIVDYMLSAFPFGVVKGGGFNRFLSKNLKAKRIEELKLPFIAVATNLQHGTLTSFGKGRLIPAIRASAAYPGVFKPVRIKGQYFVDGGISSPVPVNIAKQLNAKIIIEVDVGEQLTDGAPRHLLGVLKRSIENSYIHQAKFAREGADVLIEVPFKDVGTFADGKNMHIYLEGVNAAKKAIPFIKGKVKTLKEKGSL